LLETTRLNASYTSSLIGSTLVTAVAFGDLSYFWILERQPLSVKVLTELYSRENLTGYAAYERIDGKLIRPEAVQLLTIK
jgi:HK97 family phage major capsid protein